MSNRFYIKDEGIVDRNRDDKRLTLFELWNSLNALDNIADKNSSEYEYIKKLELENEQLKAINKYLIEILEHNGATVEIEHIKGDVE